MTQSILPIDRILESVERCLDILASELAVVDTECTTKLSLVSLYLVSGRAGMAYLVKHEWDRNESNGDERQGTACPVDAKLVVHSGCKEGEACTKS